MHEQLRDFRTMRLVRRPGRVELNGTDNPFDIASDEKNGLCVGYRNGFAPPVFSALHRERRKKTHGGSRVDRVYQELGERSKIGVRHRLGQSLDHWHVTPKKPTA